MEILRRNLQSIQVPNQKSNPKQREKFCEKLQTTTRPLRLVTLNEPSTSASAALSEERLVFVVENVVAAKIL